MEAACGGWVDFGSAVAENGSARTELNPSTALLRYVNHQSRCLRVAAFAFCGQLAPLYRRMPSPFHEPSESLAVNCIFFSSIHLPLVRVFEALDPIDTKETIRHTRSRVSDCNKVTQRAGEAGSRVLRVPLSVFSVLESEQGRQLQDGHRVSLGDVVEAYITRAGGRSPFGRKKSAGSLHSKP